MQALAAVILDTSTATADIIANNRQKIEISNSYFSQIPHNFGRLHPQPITNEQQLKREIELLDSLSDMKIAEDIIKEAESRSGNSDDLHPLDRQYAGLGMSEMTPLDRKSTEFIELEAYLQGTRGRTHRIKYEVEDIFRIERSGE
jgi:poly [ADP-ribose] polymerase